jgi:asparagine synthetase B (glutamine-hydrolysing)
MCGIAGMIKKPGREIDLAGLREMLRLTRAGGLHSAGIYLEINGTPTTYRVVGPVDLLLADPRVLASLKKADLVLLHTRNASMGKIDLENCQPFCYGNWTLLHNGHLAGMGNADVSDSNELAGILAMDGLAGMKEKLGNGWANLVILDNAKRTLTLSPDPTSPRLRVMYARGVIYFASEKAWLGPLRPNKGQVIDLAGTIEIDLAKMTPARLKNWRPAPPPRPKVTYRQTAWDRWDRAQDVDQGQGYYGADSSGVMWTRNEWKDYKKGLGY